MLLALFRHKQVLPKSYIYHITTCQKSAMSIPTFDEMRQRMLPIWQKANYTRDILWAGVFGSVARNRAHAASDVDILIVLKEHERSGEPVDLREGKFQLY
jgi:predicted nucleotidyltransferase